MLLGGNASNVNYKGQNLVCYHYTTAQLGGKPGIDPGLAVPQTTVRPSHCDPHMLAPRDGFEPPKSGALTARWHTTCRPWNVVPVVGFEPTKPEGSGFTVRPDSPSSAHWHMLADPKRLELLPDWFGASRATNYTKDL